MLSGSFLRARVNLINFISVIIIIIIIIHKGYSRIWLNLVKYDHLIITFVINLTCDHE